METFAIFVIAISVFVYNLLKGGKKKPPTRPYGLPEWDSWDEVEETPKVQESNPPPVLMSRLEQAKQQVNKQTKLAQPAKDRAAVRIVPTERTQPKRRKGTDIKNQKWRDGMVMREVLGPPRARKPYRANFDR